MSELLSEHELSCFSILSNILLLYFSGLNTYNQTMVSKVNLEPQGHKVGNVILRTLAFLCFVLASSCSTIVESQTASSKPAETTTVPSIHEFQPTLAAGVFTSEVDAKLGTPTAPISIPVIDPTLAVELIPTTEPIPTLSAERQQLIIDQFVNGPFYDQYIVDNQIPEQAATVFYQEYPGVGGQSFAVVTMKVDPASLSKEQKALKIAQSDFLVVKTETGQTEYKQLPINLQLETFPKVQWSLP